VDEDPPVVDDHHASVDEEKPRTAGSPLALRAVPTSGWSSRPSGSAKHALLRGLRLRGNEAQLTQVIAAIAQSDSGFASAFATLVLKVARSDGRHLANVEQMGTAPSELTCQAEHSVYDEYDAGLGRVDLRFDGGDDFTLFVENKLHSGFGHEQLLRYQRALKNLPDERSRSGLVAITRDIPSHGELEAGAERWLGAVRWARLYDEGLDKLPIADPDVASQWRSLLVVMHDQGDLGLTKVDSDLIVAWSRYEEGQFHLMDILNDVRQKALDILRRQMKAKHRGAGLALDDIAGLHFFGRTETVPVHREKGAVWTGFRVPASINLDTVRLTFWTKDSGEPVFSVEVVPWHAAQRLEDKNRQLFGTVSKLAKASFQGAPYKGKHVWWTEHKPEEYLDANDVPARLIELIDKDITAIVSSGVLAHDLAAAAAAGRGGPPKVGAKKRRKS